MDTTTWSSCLHGHFCDPNRRSSLDHTVGVVKIWCRGGVHESVRLMGQKAVLPPLRHHACVLVFCSGWYRRSQTAATKATGGCETWGSSELANPPPRCFAQVSRNRGES
mmetsp:Transcript_25051/g.55100  ORF Transcript_25051/g.55100 Transcript_25051/m.55100 type:complete len:109 (+) Transcript_25051:1854-2180(+)